MNSQPMKQRGIALITGLVVLLVLTMVGLAGLQASMVEQELASNQHLAVDVFQAAESGLAGGSTDTALGNALNTSGGVDVSAELSHSGNTHYVTGVSTHVEWVGEVAAPGHSLMHFSNLGFDLSAQARHFSRSNTSTQVGSALAQHDATVSKLAPKL